MRKKRKCKITMKMNSLNMKNNPSMKNNLNLRSNLIMKNSHNMMNNLNMKINPKKFTKRSFLKNNMMKMT